MKKRLKLSNGLHVWNQEWPHEVSTEFTKEAEIVQDADLKYAGLYYHDLI